MLDLDLDLEADLGIDTVKQAEMFAAIREIYNIPRDENLKLRDYPTLAQVIGFVFSKRPDLSRAQIQSNSLTTSIEASSQSMAVGDFPKHSIAPEPTVADDIQAKVLEIVAAKTGYPQDMLDLDLDLEADLGVDTVKQAEMFAAVRAAYNIPRDENLKLRDFPTIASVIRFARDRQLSSTTPALASPPSLPAKQEPQTRSEASAYEEVPTPPVSRPVASNFDAANRIPRRVPIPTLRPQLALCKPTATTLAGRRILLMPDKSGVAKELAKRLKTLGTEVLRLDQSLDANAVTEKLRAFLTVAPIQI